MADLNNNAPISWDSHLFPVGFQMSGGIRGVGVPLTRSQQRAPEEGPDDVMIPHPAGFGQLAAGMDEKSFENFPYDGLTPEYDAMMHCIDPIEFTWPDPT
jgi:hypothetical protein